jgi:hypothetical protein
MSSGAEETSGAPGGQAQTVPLQMIKRQMFSKIKTINCVGRKW